MGEIFERRSPPEPLEWTGERLTSAVGGQVEIEHLHRYFLARSMCRGYDVLDVASGEGYGSALLAQVARSVVGLELSQAAVDHANTHHSASNLRYLQGDACEIPLPEASVDVVVSFETIEHVVDQARFLREVKRVLRPDGCLLVSSPNRDVYSPPNSPANPYHVNELSPDEFAGILRAAFANVQFLQQRPLVGSAIVSGSPDAEWLTFERRGPTHFEASVGLPRYPYVLAIASDAAPSRVPHSIYIDTDEVGATLNGAQSGRSLGEEVSRLRRRAEQAEALLAEKDRELGVASANAEHLLAATQLAAASAAANRVADAEARAERLADELRNASLGHEREQREAASSRAALRRAVEAGSRLRSRIEELEGRAASLAQELQDSTSDHDRSRRETELTRAALRRAVGPGSKLRSRLEEAEARAVATERLAGEWRRLHDAMAARRKGLTLFGWRKRRQLSNGTR